MDELKEQFSLIYDQYIEKIYRFVYLKVNSQDIAEDITSRVFIKGWESYQKQNQKIKNINAFLYKIANNLVIDYYRKKNRTKTISSELLPEIIDAAENFQNKAILSADISIIKTAIKKLNEDYQNIIIWHYLGDMPISEIAQLLNKPTGTVRVMLHRGLKELKQIIQEA